MYPALQLLALVPGGLILDNGQNTLALATGHSQQSFQHQDDFVGVGLTSAEVQKALTCILAHSRVICLDEMGPIAVKTCPGEEWKQGRNRATFEPDYGRRGKLWILGAFEPATGQAAMVLSPSRDSASHIQLLEHVVVEFPADHWLLIEDNLSIHTSRQTRLALAAWPEVQIQFIPRYACWLNLIEPWWKQLRSLALKGRQVSASPASTKRSRPSSG